MPKVHRLRGVGTLAWLGLALASASCGHDAGGSDAAGAVDPDDDVVAFAAPPKTCAAIRGNGHYIVTHFTSLARIVEHHGTVTGVGGGSSGSVTAFVYESILKNPDITRCDGKPCSPARKAARVALALKSLEGYATAVVQSDEAVSIRDFGLLAAKLKREVEARDVAGLLDRDTALAATKLREVLAIPEVKDLVNPEALALLEDVPNLAFGAREVYTSIVTLGAFSVDDNRLFFRPGILHWKELAVLFARVADFYAGYGPSDHAALRGWFDACEGGALGKSWPDVAALPGPEGATCGDRFVTIVSGFRGRIRAGGAPFASRLDERIGDPSPLRKVLATSVIEGPAASAYRAARQQYLRGAVPTGNVPFAVSFDDVKFGYWASAPDLVRIMDNPGGFDDLKTRKRTALGDGTWREVLTASPAEPGLSRFVELPDGRLSGGGWSDLAPVMALKNIGCEKVIYVTREGDESPFAFKIAKHLGMTEAEFHGVFDLSDPTSGLARSVALADGVWCTNWNAFGDLQQEEMARDAYAAPFETRPSLNGIRTLTTYPNVFERTGKTGCTPGLGDGATYPR